MKMRHEIKHEITYHDMIILRKRLQTVMKRDSYAKDGVYKIRSLYFDNISDKALREKIDGVKLVVKKEIVEASQKKTKPKTTSKSTKNSATTKNKKEK